MKLTRKQDSHPDQAAAAGGSAFAEVIDRRTFLRRSGIALGGIAAATALPFSIMKKASAKTTQDIDPKAPAKLAMVL